MRPALLALVLAACSSTPARAPVEPPAGAGCVEACARLEALGCAEAEPTAEGASCVEFCTATLAQGVTLHTECVVLVESCDEVDRASQGCGR